MMLGLFQSLRAERVPVTLRELLDLHAALDARVVQSDPEAFYFLARSTLVKDERQFDKFDRGYGNWLHGLPPWTGWSRPRSRRSGSGASSCAS
jgi:uncharacterized protein with von Willebrand factor type A (vWA) domain